MSEKVTIRIDAASDGTFSVHRSGKIYVQKTHGDALALAERLVTEAGGPDRAEIKDLTNAKNH